ncbi:5449_t:CDS:2, partial [Paraglomus occultum]
MRRKKHFGKEELEEEVFDKEVEPAPAKTDIVRALEEEAAVVYKKELFQGAAQKQYIKRLIDKHGDNYKAMARDIKLNIYQHTKAQLKSNESIKRAVNHGRAAEEDLPLEGYGTKVSAKTIDWY